MSFPAENLRFPLFQLFDVIKNVTLCPNSNKDICGAAIIESDLLEGLLIPVCISLLFELNRKPILDTYWTHVGPCCLKSAKLLNLTNRLNQFANPSYIQTDYIET